MTPHARKVAGSEQAPVIAPLVVLVSCALLVLAQLYLAITLAPIIREVLGGSAEAAAAAVGTTYALAYGLGFLIFGPLSDRYGRKPILVPGMVGLALATAGLAAASSLPMVALLRSVQGLFAASFSTVALAYVGRRSRRGGGQPESARCRPPSCRRAFSVRSMRRRSPMLSAGVGFSASPRRHS